MHRRGDTCSVPRVRSRFAKRVAEGNHSTAEVLDLAASADEVDGDAVSGWVSRALAGEFKPAPAEKVKTPKTITATLRHYQEDGLAWLARLEANDLGGILADDMGLGEDRAGTGDHRLRHRDHEAEEDEAEGTHARRRAHLGGHQLVARSRALRAEGLRVALHHGSSPGGSGRVHRHGGHRGHELRRDAAGRAAPRHRAAPRGARRGAGHQEPHHRNHEGGAQAKGSRRLIVTGTPVENHLGELWSLMSFADPGLPGTQASVQGPLRRLRRAPRPARCTRRAAASASPRLSCVGTRPTRASPTSCPSASSCGTTAR